MKEDKRTRKRTANVKIDKNVPLPPKAIEKYPFEDMEVGDSFLFPDHVKKTSAYAMGHKMNNIYKERTMENRFTVRRTPEGYRCWRIQ